MRSSILIKYKWFSLLLIVTTFVLSINYTFSKDTILDILVTNATVYNGVANSSSFTNVGVKGDKIVYIGNKLPENKLKIDATGLILSPGFVDMQTHSDNGMLDSKLSYDMYLRQGITTILTGNCGQSPADLKSFTKKIKPDVNYIILTGYNMLKIKSQKNPNKSASKKELKTMSAKLRKEMENGSIGLSLGLAYYPVYTLKQSFDEVIYLIKSVKDLNPIIKTHIRSESVDIETSIKEVINISQITNTPLFISHAKIMGKENEGLSSKILSLIDYHRSLGQEIYLDVYPYLASSSYLAILLPDYFKIVKGKKIKYDSDTISKIKDKMHKKGGADKVLITLCKKKEYEGKTIRQIAKLLNTTEEKAVITILKSDSETIALYFSTNERDMNRFLDYDYTYLGTDSSMGLLNHPRATASFPLFVNLVKDHIDYSEHTYGEILSKMSSKPFENLNFDKRGKILLGYYADFIIFDGNNYKPLSTYDNPKEYSEGVEYVIINGKVVLNKGKILNKGCGRLIK